MQISRSWLIACAAACATTLAVRGNDTPAQIKAREALQQKLQESPSQPTTSSPPAAPAPQAASVQQSDSDAIAKAREALRQKMSQPPQVAPTAAASAPAPAPAPAPATVPPQPAPVPAAAPAAHAISSDTPVPPPATTAQSADPDAIAKAREAVRQHIQENTPPPAAPVPMPAPAPSAAAAAPAPVAPSAPTNVKVVPPLEPQPAAESDSITKAREAVRERIGENNNVGPKADAESIAKARESVRQRMQNMSYAEAASRPGNSTSMNFMPLEGPPLPISSEKHEKLNELLQRYKADQVTPEQYQTERAKILAGP